MGLPGLEWQTHGQPLALTAHLPLSPQVAWLYRKQSQIQNQEDTDLDSDLEAFY